MACEYVPGCTGCQGFLCERGCKNDSSRICLEPALTQFGAQMLTECEVLRLEATRDEVTGVVCSMGGKEFRLQGKVVVLATGALGTPRVLLSSVSSDWSQGLANDSGLVGRNLMRHYVDLYAIFLDRTNGQRGNLKELAFNDFYCLPDRKFGSVQSFGTMIPGWVIMEELDQRLRDGPVGRAAGLLAPLKPVLQCLVDRYFSRAIVLAATMEDLPYQDNRVLLRKQAVKGGRRGLAISYTIREGERARIQAFRETLREVFQPYRHTLIKRAEQNSMLAHACGTCRFGSDPATSVLDGNNKAHGLSNLYVVDSSFFPSSGGTNPSLTIAANALRVAAHLCQA